MGSSGGALRKNQILLYSLDFGFCRFEGFLFLLYVFKPESCYLLCLNGWFLGSIF
ncbi:hypothetical protein RchiOBHm_Chr5g0064191 [Rosa chinensis]|uniref:Uncharacterized protein n=1 Tax=Rosa chinensis TaxID=74649 RepID=A0A2P6QIN1_ROSCH|nr:hypothetical protein RchiOBHm_Chr5g0064191 [Rosa chinensis]